MADTDNIARIRAVHHALEDLADLVVFVGGATVSLYKDRPATEVRVTDDVDIVIEMLNYTSFAQFEEQLRRKGFIHDTASGIICRYKINGIIVDVMPTHGNVLGFNNKWYADGVQHAIPCTIGEKENIKIFTPAFFIASKLDAFKDRGNGDGRFSSDFEDIVYILNNRNTIWEDIKNAPTAVNAYLKEEFRHLLKGDYLYEWISCHLEYHEQKRVMYILGGLTDFIK